MLVDCHTHLDQYPDAELVGIVARAGEAGVGVILLAGTTVESSARCIALAGTDPALLAGVGVHPTDVQGALDGPGLPPPRPGPLQPAGRSGQRGRVGLRRAGPGPGPPVPGLPRAGAPGQGPASARHLPLARPPERAGDAPRGAARPAGGAGMGGGRRHALLPGGRGCRCGVPGPGLPRLPGQAPAATPAPPGAGRRSPPRWDRPGDGRLPPALQGQTRALDRAKGRATGGGEAGGAQGGHLQEVARATCDNLLRLYRRLGGAAAATMEEALRAGPRAEATPRPVPGPPTQPTP